MATYAIINGTAVVNIVQWDGVTPYNVAPNTLVATAGNPAAQIGGTYSGGIFTAPVPGAPAQGIIDIVLATSGGSHQIPTPPQPQNEVYVYLEAGATMATYSITLPAVPLDDCKVHLISQVAITALTINASAGQGGANISLPLTFGAQAKTSYSLTFSAQLSQWFQW